MIDKLIDKINHKYFLLLLLITIFGFIIRIYQITNIPHGFFADEASIGYNAYTLIHSGKDEFGNQFPILFQNFGTFFRPGVSIYISSFFVNFFGLNEFALRLSSAVIGTLTIIVVFYLAKILFSSKRIGLLASLFLAISPWHIHFSRINQEFIYLVFFLTLSALIFLISIRNNKPILLILALFLFGISLYTYVTAYFLIPVFIFLIFLIYYKNLLIMKKALFAGIIVFIFISLPLISGLSDGKTLSRFNQISSVNREKTTDEIINGTIDTYKNHFLPDFLFIKGDIGYKTHFITRFSVKGIGELYLFQLPFILFGLVSSFKRNKKSFLLLLSWLFIYPLGSTAAPFADGGGPFATRSIIGVIPFQILSAVGIIFLFSLIKINFYKLLTGIVIAIIILFSFQNYLHKYFVEYPLYSSDFWGWQFGAKDIVKYFVDNQSKYDQLLMAPEFNAPDIFLKFYSPNDCRKCLIGIPQDHYNPEIKQLFAISPSYLQSNYLNFKTIKDLYYPNGALAFKIGEVLK